MTPRFLRIGLPDVFAEQGSQEELRALYGLDTAGITRLIRTFFGREAARQSSVGTR